MRGISFWLAIGMLGTAVPAAAVQSRFTSVLANRSIVKAYNQTDGWCLFTYPGSDQNSFHVRHRHTQL